MIEFEAGAIFGVCMTIVLMLIFIRIFGADDEPPRDDFDIWGDQYG